MGKKSEQGNVIELVIIGVLVLVIAGLVVWRFMGGSSNTTNSSSQDSTTSQEAATTNSSDTKNSTSQAADPNEGYVVIAGWGVRFKTISGFSVKYYKAPDSSGYELYEFTTPTVEALDGCSGKNTAGRINAYLGGVERTTEKLDLENMASAPKALYNGNKIGNYYYYYSHPQALCSMSDADTATETAQTATMQSFLSTLEPAL